MTTRRVVGCMTGTSLDALDAALVEIQGAGFGMRARFLRALSRPLGPLATPLRRLASQEPLRAGEIAEAALALAHLHAHAIRDLLAGDPCDLVGVHGQTVYHRPPTSWQLLQPAPIARAIAAPVVFDLRQADLAAGGQGAPITPIADFILYRSLAPHPAVANLGGFCNVTSWTPGDPASIRGQDVCACNQLLDAIARERLGLPFDDAGAHAARGTIRPDARADLDAVLAEQARAGRSLGTGDEALAWLARHPHASGQDLAATAVDALARCISASVPSADPLVLAGGGLRNRALKHAIAHTHPARVIASDEAGIPAPYREAAAFAVLAALCHDRVPITIPAVTRTPAPAPIAGAWINPPQGPHPRTP